MWVITNRGLLSVVEDIGDPATLIVRARQEGLLEAMIKDAGLGVGVWQDDFADYPYRAKMTRIDFTDLLYSQVLKIDYPNFKNSVRDARLRALLPRVWSILTNLGIGAYYGFSRRPGPRLNCGPFMDPEEAFFRSLPEDALLDDGSLNPHYIEGDEPYYDDEEERTTL